MEKNEKWACIKCNQNDKIGVPISYGLCFDCYTEIFELIAEQKKQILGFAKDNALLHQKLKKCQEIIKEFKDAEVLDFDTPTWIIRKGFKEGEKRG